MNKPKLFPFTNERQSFKVCHTLRPRTPGNVQRFTNVIPETRLWRMLGWETVIWPKASQWVWWVSAKPWAASSYFPLYTMMIFQDSPSLRTSEGQFTTDSCPRNWTWKNLSAIFYCCASNCSRTPAYLSWQTNIVVVHQLEIVGLNCQT